jgi:hypothetical protein
VLRAIYTLESGFHTRRESEVRQERDGHPTVMYAYLRFKAKTIDRDVHAELGRGAFENSNNLRDTES